MKALTLYQPWASLVAVGAKRIETRSWQTPYRGRLAIHAAKTEPRHPWPPGAARALADAGEGVALLPRGAVVATCDLVLVMAVEETLDLSIPEEAREAAFGDYSPGRFAWLLANVEPLSDPFPARGRQGLWELPAEWAG